MQKYLRYVEFACQADLYEEFEECFSKIIPFISRIYEHYVCPVPSIATAKIIANLDSDTSYSTMSIDENGGIVGIQIPFDKEYFLKLESVEKLIYIQKLFFNAIEEYAEKGKWENYELLIEKHQLLLDKKLIFRDYLKRAKTSPDRKYKAQFYFEFDYKSDGAYLSFFDKNKNENRILFAPSGYCFFCESVKTMKWIDNETVKVDYYNNRDYWTININTKKVTFHYPRIDKNDGHAFFDLALLYLEGTQIVKDEKKGMFYLEKAAELNYKRARKKTNQITGGFAAKTSNG